MTLGKTRFKRFYPVLLLLAYLSLMGVDVYLLDHLSKSQLTEILKRWVPLSLKVNFFMLVTALFFCYRDLLEVIRKFSNTKGILLLLLLLTSFFLCSFASPRTHRIYFDEDIYGNVGQNIAVAGLTGFCNYGVFEYGEYSPHWISYNKEPSGWPFLISIPFQLLGTDEIFAFLLNNLLFVLGVLSAFFIPWYLTGSYFVGFSAALGYALIPHNLVWFNTASAEPSAAVMAGLAALSLVVYLKTAKRRHLFVAVLLFPLACQMRPESFMILVWGLAALLLLSPGKFLDRSLWAAGLLTTLFLLPHVLHFYAVSGHSWGAQGNKFSLEFLRHNLNTNGFYYLNNKSFPLLMTLLALPGLFCFRGLVRWRMLMLAWFLMFWGIFLFFYAGSYQYGADVRFALVSFLPLSILAGMGAGWLRGKLFEFVAWTKGNAPAQKGTVPRLVSAYLVIFLMVFCTLKFLPMVRVVGQEAWGSRYDHRYAREFVGMIPDRSIVLTQNPTMLLLWGQNAIQTYAGINNPGLIKDLMKKYQGHVYFHDNYWCNTRNKRNIRLCAEIREKYDLEPVATASEQNYNYGLYKMRFRESDAP